MCCQILKLLRGFPCRSWHLAGWLTIRNNLACSAVFHPEVPCSRSGIVTGLKRMCVCNHHGQVQCTHSLCKGSSQSVWLLAHWGVVVPLVHVHACSCTPECVLPQAWGYFGRLIRSAEQGCISPWKLCLLHTATTARPQCPPGLYSILHSMA